MSETRIVSRAELVRIRQEAGSMVRRAIGAIALIPVVLVGVYALGPLLAESAALVMMGLAAFYMLVAGFFGTAFLASGAVQYRRTTKRLKAFDDIGELPEARVVSR